MAIVKICTSQGAARNTGKEGDISMGPVAMLIMVPRSLRFSLAQVKDPLSWITPLLHAAPQDRVYPLFGAVAPVRTLTNSAGADVTVTLDDGLEVFLRHGIYSRLLATTSGGLPYAQALQSFIDSGYAIVEIDQSGKCLVHQYGPDSFGGILTDSMYAPAPQLANLRDAVYMNRFQYSYSPLEMVMNGKVLFGAAPLLTVSGLINASIFEAAAATTTKLKIKVLTECAELDLISMFPTQLPLVNNFIVKNKATGNVIALTGAAVVGGFIELSGTFVVGQTYIVYGANASVTYANNVVGYEMVNSAEILVAA